MYMWLDRLSESLSGRVSENDRMFWNSYYDLHAY